MGDQQSPIEPTSHGAIKRLRKRLAKIPALRDTWNFGLKVRRSYRMRLEASRNAKRRILPTQKEPFSLRKIMCSLGLHGSAPFPNNETHSICPHCLRYRGKYSEANFDARH